jgi:hypothetical protein
VVKSDQQLQRDCLRIFSSAVEGAVRNGLNDLFLVAEEDITWLGDAAKRFEEEASQLDEPEKSSLGLLAAVYRERAEMHQALVEKLRPAKKPTKSLGKARTDAAER